MMNDWTNSMDGQGQCTKRGGKVPVDKQFSTLIQILACASSQHRKLVCDDTESVHLMALKKNQNLQLEEELRIVHVMMVRLMMMMMQHHTQRMCLVNDRYWVLVTKEESNESQGHLLSWRQEHGEKQSRKTDALLSCPRKNCCERLHQTAQEARQPWWGKLKWGPIAMAKDPWTQKLAGLWILFLVTLPLAIAEMVLVVLG
jgi:hypothetical protein